MWYTQELVLAACDPSSLSRTEPTAKLSACLLGSPKARSLQPKRNVKSFRTKMSQGPHSGLKRAAPKFQGVASSQATQGSNRICLRATDKLDIDALLCSGYLSLLKDGFSLLFSASRWPRPAADQAASNSEFSVESMLKTYNSMGG
jgi:hypothetical protein